MDPATFRSLHQSGLPYDDYLRTGTLQQQENWNAIHEQLQLTPQQQGLIEGFSRKINVIALSGIWCGDCVAQGPMFARIAAANPSAVDMTWLDRDAVPELANMVMINQGLRVPVLIFLAEDYEFVAWYGDRSLTRYRALAAKQLGGSCPLPGAPVDADELAGTLQDWVDQFERVHLLLRLSTRLRQVHGD